MEWWKGVDIVQVIGSYGVSLKKRGQEWVGLCPFHPEKTPSFHVHPGKGLYYCFGCGAGGDVVKFVQQMEGVRFGEALRILSDLTGITPPDPPKASPKPQVPLVPLRGSPGEAYWKGRGLTLEVADLMKVGYVPPSDHPLSGRVVIPLPRGGWVGRSTDGGVPKYLYYPQGYKVSSVLPTWGRGRVLVLVEGVLDAAAILSVVDSSQVKVGAILGGSLSPAQRAIVVGMAPEKVLLGMDMDPTGVEARLKALDLLRGYVPLGVIRWPWKDPGEGLAKGEGEKLKEAIENPLPAEEFLWTLAKKRYGDDLGKTLRFLSPFLEPSSHSDPIPTTLKNLLEREGVVLPKGPKETPAPIRDWSPPLRKATVEADIAALLLSMPEGVRKEGIEKVREYLLEYPPLLQAIEAGSREKLETMQEASLLWARLGQLPPLSPQEAMDMLRVLVARANLEYLHREYLRVRQDPKEAGILLGLMEDIRARLRRGEW